MLGACGSGSGQCEPATLEFRALLAVAAGTPTEPTPTDESSRPARPASPSDASYYVTARIQQAFDELDCTDPQARAARAGTDDASVTCDADGSTKYILGPVEVRGVRVVKATVDRAEPVNGTKDPRWVVALEFDEQGTRQFATTSQRLVSLMPPANRLGIVVDGLVISAPAMEAAIVDGKAEISGANFTGESAGALARGLTCPRAR